MSLLFYLLRGSWGATWKNPRLWLFGFFLAVLGQGGASAVFLRPAETLSATSQGVPLLDVFFGNEFWWVGSGTLVEFLHHPSNPALLTPILVRVIAGVFVFVAIVISMAAVPMATRTIIERRRQLSFGQLIAESRKYFWNIAAVFLLSSFTFVLLLSPIALLSGHTTLLRSAGGLPTFLTFFLVAAASVSVFFVALYATNAIVLRAKGVRDAIKEAWEIFAAHWIASVEFGAIFYLLTVVMAHLIDSVVLPIARFSIVSKIYLAVHGYTNLAEFTYFAFEVLLPVIISGLFLALFAVFQSAFWSLLYLHLSGKSPSKTRVHFFSPWKAEPKNVTS